MNGLRFIRRQCNLSMSEFADRIGVSRQTINMWELGKRAIPKARKQQMAEYFGLDEEYFGEISEVQKQELLGKAMFRYCENGIETYRYKPDKSQPFFMAYFLREREYTLAEEFALLKKNQKQLIERIDKQISGPKGLNIMDQQTYLNRGNRLYARLADSLDTVYTSPTRDKMGKYYKLLTVMEAVRRMLGGESESLDFVDEDKVNRIMEVLDVELSDVTSIVMKRSQADPIKRLEKHDDMTIEEQIQWAETFYLSNGPLEGEKAFAVGIRSVEKLNE